MEIIFTCFAISAATLSFGGEPDVDRIQKLLKSDGYTVILGTARAFDPAAELDIGKGNGHGGSFEWLRFLPCRDHVGVLSIDLDQELEPYDTAWPPDRASVVIKHARMKRADYAALLRDIAIVDSAKLHAVERNSLTFGSGNFWVSARLIAGNKTLVDLDWSGYPATLSDLDSAKPEATVALATAATKGLEFKKRGLTDEEKQWASARFARDWKKIKDLDSHWWVRERYVITIGLVGNGSVLPALADVLRGDPEDRCVYYAINAITRLTKKDLRDKPVEEMDVERVRRRILESIPLKK